MFHENNINIKKKVTLKQLKKNNIGLKFPKPNVTPIYLKHILGKSLN
jgi:hypothetical protein